ncbi:sodium transporter, partial [Candidatus Aminicenantes bacterium AC-335-O07]|nr:sodium transporter [Candidatus Aminicenantes bacterium AC-335-O07]
ILGTYVVQNSAFLNKLPQGNYDYLLPTFVIEKMPPGIVGFILIAIMAAAMSSLDSSINSLSAATVEDIYKRLRKKKIDTDKEMRLSKTFTFLWGMFCIGFAFFVKNISPTIIEAINKIGSAFYGPVLAVFFAGIVFKRSKSFPAILGLGTGVIFNLYLWFFVPSVSWLWWNAIGFLIAIIIILVGSYLSSEPHPINQIQIPLEKKIWKISYAILALYTVFLIALLIFLPKILTY